MVVLTRDKPNPNYDLAISDYTRAIELDPNDARSYGNRGLSYTIKADPEYEKALVDFGKALELSPDLMEVYICRAILYAGFGDCVSALRDYDIALKIEPRVVEAPLSPALKKCIEARNRERAAQTEQ